MHITRPFDFTSFRISNRLRRTNKLKQNIFHVLNKPVGENISVSTDII